jgi:TorA maturation chaperone TorD
LVASARSLSCADISNEYNALFVSVGKPEVTLYGSFYLSGFLNEKPLVQLRTDIAELGLGRDEAQSITEDHVSYVLEVMRYLIAGDDVTISNLTRQRAFFARHVQSWLPAMCESLASHPKASFYKSVAVFAEAFISVEAQGFDMLE